MHVTITVNLPHIFKSSLYGNKIAMCVNKICTKT